MNAYCDSIESNNIAKEAHILKTQLERALQSICGVTAKRRIDVKLPGIVTEILAIGVPRNSILYDIMRDVSERLFEAGILQHSYQLQMDMAFPVNPKIPEDKRRILSMFDLGYGFESWLIACGISSIVFVIEILTFWLPRAMKKFKMLLRSLIGVNVLLNWLKNYH